MARRVMLGERYVDKPGAQVSADDILRVVELEHPWVGRGGMKLAHALREFAIDVNGKTCADIGASTGGFTDVMLKSGATKVYAIDVGYGQLDQSLRNDPRVINREKVNARYLGAEDFEEPIDFASIDVSFISLTKILPAVVPIAPAGTEFLILIKPQFELEKRDVGKGGIVRDAGLREKAVERVRAAAIEAGLEILGVRPSRVAGAEGNQEFFLHARRSG